MYTRTLSHIFIVFEVYDERKQYNRSQFNGYILEVEVNENHMGTTIL